MIVPIITPLTTEYDVDVPALQNLCELQIEAGIDVLFVLGTTGEFYGLTPKQRRQVVDTALEAAAGRAPVIAGISGDSTISSLATLADCRDPRLAGYVASTPYFLNYTQQELTEHFRILADAAGSQPLILYNYPDRYRHVIEISTVEQLVSEKRVLGIKDTAGNLQYFQKLLRLKQSFPGFLVFEGALSNLALSAPLGIDGSVQAIGNLLPHECAQLWARIRRQELQPLAEDVARLWAFHQEIETVAIFIAALKACMALRGWCLPITSQPTAPLGRGDVARLCRMIDEAYPDRRVVEMQPSRPH
jgi:dihydrodipicolinate synthase/N-acetylneuraminate lyase